jgi:Arc/MetJ-type ribon-helix-helix transcriptional regulator
MATVGVELPDDLAREVQGLVQDGWFSNESEVLRLAVAEFVRRRRFELAEQFQRDDIAWALRHTKPPQ